MARAGTDALTRLAALCRGDGRRLDLLEAALALSEAHRLDAGEAGPISLAPYRQQVAAMATDLADLVRRRGGDPDRLAEVIARAYAYRGDRETYDDLQNADLARVIERRKGLPVALSILYLHAARQQVLVWTVNDQAKMRELGEWGVDGIISDETELLVKTFA